MSPEEVTRLRELAATWKEQASRAHAAATKHDAETAGNVDEYGIWGCADELESLVRASAPSVVEPAKEPWQSIDTVPKDGRLVIGALITNGKIWRIHDMKHNGLAFYTIGGGSLPQMTHWLDAPSAVEAKEPQ